MGPKAQAHMNLLVYNSVDPAGECLTLLNKSVAVLLDYELTTVILNLFFYQNFCVFKAKTFGVLKNAH